MATSTVLTAVRYQELEWSCGPSAIVNAARALGKRIAERRVRKLAGCKRDEGTDDWQMLDAIRALELVAEPLLTEDRTAAWALIRSSVLAGRPVVICIDNWQHWTTVIGVVGDRVLLVDPTFAKGNQQENGVHSLNKTELLRRWKHRHLGQWYGIAIGRKR